MVCIQAEAARLLTVRVELQEVVEEPSPGVVAAEDSTLSSLVLEVMEVETFAAA